MVLSIGRLEPVIDNAIPGKLTPRVDALTLIAAELRVLPGVGVAAYAPAKLWSSAM